MGGRVILYELNEVPWEVIDRYVAAEPSSALAAALPRCAAATTVNDDPAHLQPWRSWPTFHTGMYAGAHGSMELGQDPDTFAGETIWQAAESAGRTIGLFGVMQSWPPRPPANGGFWVPDTFARGPETHPPALQTFQAFNLGMTSENSTSSTAPLDARKMAVAGADMVRRGLRPRSVLDIVRHLARERRDRRWKGARPMLQALPSFDLYWRLHRETEPDLSIFFTNHVAGMMHRYWGDAFEDYSETYDYKRDAIFATFVDDAMRLFDRQLARLTSYVDRRTDTTLVIASSMGQRAVPYQHIGDTYVIRDTEVLREAFALPPSEAGLAMHPHWSLQYATVRDVDTVVDTLSPVEINGVPLFKSIHRAGTTVSLELNRYAGRGPVRLRNGSSGSDDICELADIGIAVEERLGGGNTAYHIPEGIWLAYGPGVTPNASRDRFSVLDAKPRILEMLGV